MRISTRGAYLNGLSAIQRLHTAIGQTQRQISAGRRILTPSEDPIGSARSIEFRETLSRLSQFDRNAGIAENRLMVEELALRGVNDALQRVRELALQAGNATQSDETRTLIAIEIRQQLDYLVQLANQQDGSGRFLFSGNLDKVEPVSRSGSVYTYNGDQGQRSIQIGENRQIADGDAGAEVFFRTRNGNGVFSVVSAGGNTGSGVIGTGSLVDPALYDQAQYTVRFIDPSNYVVLDSSAAVVTSNTFQSGDVIAFRGIQFSIDGEPAVADEFQISPSRFQDIFSMIDNLATVIESTTPDEAAKAAMRNGINRGILNIDQSIGKILDVRTQVGSRLSVIENQVDNNEAFALVIQTTLADIENLDYAEAISRLSAQSNTLEAAQKSFIRTQQLSLFNYF